MSVEDDWSIADVRFKSGRHPRPALFETGFRVFAQAARGARITTVDPETNQARAGFRILIVDDEPPVLQMIDEVLRGKGYDTLAFSSPVEALKKARIQKFDGLVLDLYMPQMSGMLFHAKLRVFDPELANRTVFISGYIAREELRNYLSSTPTFLEKPFKTDDLLAMVSGVLPASPRRLKVPPPAPPPPGVEKG